MSENKKQKKINNHKLPSWKIKIEKEIEKMQGELSIIEELARSTDVKSRKARKVKKKYKIKSLKDIPTIKEILKQKI